ncbi:MAG: amidohydrolase family protein [Betaproteobacteria bacterium]|nr:amidohydrolase family protein [Betaproteobacteria bacterium]
MSTLLFRNASVLDGSGALPFRGDVLVDGARIAAVAPAGQLPARVDARTIECGGATLMPGLIEPHTHLSFVDQATPDAFSNLPVEEHLLLTLKHAKLYLDSGYTACFSAAATKPRLDVVTRNAIDRGEHPGPRLRAASVQLTVTGGVGDLRQMHLDPGEAMFTLPCDGPVEFRRAAREACREGVDVLKIVPSGDTSTPAVPSARTLMTDDEVAAVCEVARGHQRVVAAHARSAESVKMCVRHGVTVIYHASYADEEALDMIEAHKDSIFVAPALSVTITRLRDAGKFGLPSSDAMKKRIETDLQSTIAAMKALKKRGVKVLPGGDYGFKWNPHGNNARDLTYFVELLGYTPMEAIVGATQWGGEIMGMGDELGLVRNGYLADLLLVDGDPLADLTILEDRNRLLAIMKGGVFHKPPAPTGAARPRDSA